MAAPAPLYRRLGMRLVDLRRARKLTQADVAEQISRSTEYIGRIERGEKRIQIEDLGKLADTLGISLAELFHGVHTSNKLFAGERRGRYDTRTPDEDRVVELIQLVRTIENEDIDVLIAMARRLMVTRPK